jgi:hypothetical protein
MNEKAEESHRIKRAREKLEKQFAEEQEMVNPERLNAAMAQIYRWIERNSSERVNLKGKDIVLFDDNAHSASTTSKFVKELRHRLISVGSSVDPEEEGDEVRENPLRGRMNAPDEKTPKKDS